MGTGYPGEIIDNNRTVSGSADTLPPPRRQLPYRESAVFPGYPVRGKFPDR